FPALTSVGDDLAFYDHDALTAVSGFPKLAAVGGDVVFYDQPQLASVGGFQALTHVGGSLAFGLTFAGEDEARVNPKLSSLPTFPLLANVGRLDVQGAGELVTLSGFSALNEVRGHLVISDNAK